MKIIRVAVVIVIFMLAVTPLSACNKAPLAGPFSKIVAGQYQSIALKTDGTVWIWGWVTTQSSKTTLSFRSEPLPVQVAGIEAIIDIDTNLRVFAAVRADGTVYVWGDTHSGQAGYSSTEYVMKPTRIAELDSVVSVSVGASHILAIKSDGTVWAWGSNNYGQLGNGTLEDSNIPVQVQNLSSVIEIATGWSHSVALNSDGTVWAWGYNWRGCLGDVDLERSAKPIMVRGISEVVSISSRTIHVVALKEDGTVWAWGDNNSGQIGAYKGDFPDQITHKPQIIDLPIKAVSVDAASGRTLIVLADGTVFGLGQPGYGIPFDPLDRNTPTRIPNLSGIVAVSDGGYHMLALNSEGYVLALGTNEFGQLGHKTGSAMHYMPVYVREK